jgi:hypothetical protein
LFWELFRTVAQEVEEHQLGQLVSLRSHGDGSFSAEYVDAPARDEKFPGKGRKLGGRVAPPPHERWARLNIPLHMQSCNDFCASQLVSVGKYIGNGAATMWGCARCTFENHEATPDCEICGMPRAPAEAPTSAPQSSTVEQSRPPPGHKENPIYID